MVCNNYEKFILERPWFAILLVCITVAVFASQATNFELDASADSLVLENDEALRFYRSIRARYGSDDYLIVTYSPKADLYAADTLADIAKLRDEITSIPRVESSVSILDVPLLQSPPVSLSDLRTIIPTLAHARTKIDLAREEFRTSPLYKDLLVGGDGKTTALQINFRHDATYDRLLEGRDRLREIRLNRPLSREEANDLKSISSKFKIHSKNILRQQSDDIEKIRNIMASHQEHAVLYLGGVPMIVADSIDFIRNDLATFGFAVLFLLVIIISMVFRKPRWVALPLITCFFVIVIMIGFLGLVGWPVTVVSSNFVSILLIVTLSLTVHLIVRYRELADRNPAWNQKDLVKETVRSKSVPCIYTAITTMVAFSSLLLSNIRPVIDFGWMMSVGIFIALIVSFVFFPAALMLLNPVPGNSGNVTARITHYFAGLNQRRGGLVLVLCALCVALSIIGMTRLTVENRFIDYYKDSTEIYRGMELIDQRLGGTTPFDVIIDAPGDIVARDESQADPMELWIDGGEIELMKDGAGITGTSYWFNSFMLEDVAAIHDYLDGLTETGKVLSITTAMRMLSYLNEEMSVNDFFLSLLHKRLPEEIKASLFAPYISKDGGQIRFGIRLYESDATLQRNKLLQKIYHHLTNELGLEKNQVRFSGMAVLYNNLLQSLFRSQILTIGVVFFVILVMFVVLFRNLKVACIAIIPNVFAAALILGIMGWFGIPLDIMTITIAAICIGIAVDNTIHYVHRFRSEFQKDMDYWAAMKRSHNSIGRAMYYTTITITMGFSVLALSNFIPTIYFGLLTGFSMLVALLADLTLLPILMVKLKPFGINTPHHC